MQLSDIKSMYHRHELVEAIVEPSLIANGWIVEFKTEEGDIIPLTDFSGHEKCYRNLDIATATAQQVGFPSVRIDEPF